MRGDLDTLRVCLKYEAKRTLRTEGVPYSLFLLHGAAVRNVFAENLFEVLQMLVISDNLETMTDRLGRSIAHVASSYNMVSMVSSILQQYPSLAESIDSEGNSVLHAACRA